MTRSIGARARAGDKVLLGVIHLLPLPGSPRFESRGAVLGRALADAEALMSGGLDGFVVENFGDAPFFGDRVPAATIAEMAVLGERLRVAVGAEPLLGVNVLRNDARAALAIAAAIGADFIRVNVHTGVMLTDQGSIEGRAHETLRERAASGASVEILADVAVKHATPPAGFDLVQSAKDTAYRGLADGLIVTGSGTGEATSLERLERVRAAVPDRPLLVGSGAGAATIAALLRVADGAIVGTSLKREGRVAEPVELERVRALMRAAG
ncbi:MAG: BtpA/SgcQ family protein [Polyangiaceae bacterium]|nr:BtpA/SgcQ family protein [Polyangiaceae bacterium]MCE7888305.1 phosphorybosylanthranilate isomerase [Sorangiineae bacterium PRO1]MCL4753550.1 BtpA/SgcQ family protein [Myxococcales bacterium]